MFSNIDKINYISYFTKKVKQKQKHYIDQTMPSSIGYPPRPNTTSDANDDLCQIWKECKQNCRFFFKVKPEKLEKNAKN